MRGVGATAFVPWTTVAIGTSSVSRRRRWGSRTWTSCCRRATGSPDPRCAKPTVFILLIFNDIYVYERYTEAALKYIRGTECVSRYYSIIFRFFKEKTHFIHLFSSRNFFPLVWSKTTTYFPRTVPIVSSHTIFFNQPFSSWILLISCIQYNTSSGSWLDLKKVVDLHFLN